MTLDTGRIHSWLTNLLTESADGKYRHRVVRESFHLRASILDDVKQYVQTAHDDALATLRKGFELLDPLDEPPTYDPAEGYPSRLPIVTLKGYFGEIFAAIIAEHFKPFGEEGWKVPAFLFRFHDTAFHELARAKQAGQPIRTIFGRVGDDCLAFQMNDDNSIIRSLVCEAKCTHDHDASSIQKAHEKLSEQVSIPVSLFQVIEVLDGCDEPEPVKWRDALRRLYYRIQHPEYRRYDLVSYICGQFPVRNSAWMSVKQPHAAYSGNRRLEAVEVHLNNVDGLVRYVYESG